MYKNDFKMKYAVQKMNQENIDRQNIYKWVNNITIYDMYDIHRDVLGIDTSPLFRRVTVCNIYRDVMPGKIINLWQYESLYMYT